ncbi:hypothetical protein JZ751_017686 [Albula glossodonta]|uniref:Cadherin EGF LAG seven-pass G-type receptor 2 n=1 Tax=Albula glossodonta TaxID=121402 RepID=A0A8T2PP36_9TELE|nr:hypothetical protein JZ751_017686 [Albula glossodonta]
MINVGSKQKERRRFWEVAGRAEGSAALIIQAYVRIASWQAQPGASRDTFCRHADVPSSSTCVTQALPGDCMIPRIITCPGTLPHLFPGERCELSSRSGRCTPGVCKNGGTCVNLLVGGFKCECPAGAYEKPYCQMTTRGFPPQSFLTFKGLRQRFHFTLSLTEVLQGPCSHFCLSLHSSVIYVQLWVKEAWCGETKTQVSPFILGGVSDGQWHMVQVHYYNKTLELCNSSDWALTGQWIGRCARGKLEEWGLGQGVFSQLVTRGPLNTGTRGPQQICNPQSRLAGPAFVGAPAGPQGLTGPLTGRTDGAIARRVTCRQDGRWTLRAETEPASLSQAARPVPSRLPWKKTQAYKAAPLATAPVLNQAGLPQGPSDQKVVVVTVDDCDTSVALKFGHAIGNYSCSAQGSQSGSKKSLDLTGPLLLGGVPKLPEAFPVQTRQFVGCMKNLQIDNRHIDMASHIANNGTVPGCSSKRNFCSTNPCLNGGTCVNRWGSFSCDCPLGFGGRNCEKAMASPQRFQGNSLVQWNNPAAVVTVPWHVEMMFRTRQPSAVLLRITAGQQHTITLQLQNGSVMMSLQRGEDSTLSRLEVVKANDGDWHHLQLELRGGWAGVATRHQVILSLDYGLHMASVEVDSKLKGLKLRTLIQAKKVNVERGCSLSDPCDFSPCPANSYCSNDWDSHSCTCHPGYYGDECTDVCSLNPCEHQSVCTRSPSSSHGYTCDCPSNYFGQYCEKRSDQPCPRGWWGHKTCGPCSCQTDKGFDSDCNKTTGECRCKASHPESDNHYQPPGSDFCLLCDCYPVGSFSRACDRESGQCQCKPGVIGRQCDRCDNPFAEVSPSGCEVIYDSCPQAKEAGIWWPRTKFGLPAAVPCPKGSIGTAIRHCDEHKGWLPPNLFNCTSVSFAKLKTISEELARNVSHLDSTRVRHVAAMLSNASQHTASLYGSDVKVAYRLTQSLLQHESSQHGFGLAATQDVHFTENLLRVGSAILAPDTEVHWELIQQTEGGTALLLQQYEEYANTLAQNMRKTYLSPFTIVTPNIVISVDRLEKMNFAGAKLPRYKALRGAWPADLETAVTLPDSVFESAREGKGLRTPPAPAPAPALPTDAPGNHTVNRKRRHPDERNGDAIASVIIFHSLASLLPERYDPDKRSLRVPKRPVINTPVVSITVHDNEELLQHTLEKPITVQFRLVHSEDRSKPICVFWNHSILAGGTGGWSAKGCEVVFRNHTHISCQCYHMTSFAVLMDISRRENGEILPVKLVTWSTVGVTLGFLFLTTVFLICLRAMHCNKTSIINNGATALFLSELIFILGINQADSPFLCTVIAILLHFFYLCTFAWLFLEGLHVYRMLSEVRDVNYGPMRFYYTIGWGVPAFITGLAVGLDPEGYGNPDFCWLSMYDTLIWSFAGPIALVVSINIFLYVLSSKASCSLRHHGFEKKESPVDSIIFHYMFAGFNCLQGPFIFFFRIVFNKEVRTAIRYCCSRKRPDNMMGSKSLTSAYNCNSIYMGGRLYQPPFGDSSVSLNGTLQSGKSQQSYVPFVLREDAGLNNNQDSDSDSDLSLEDDQSGSFASSHSSDSEDEEGPYPPEACWESLAAHIGKHPHLTHKDNNLSKLLWPGEFVTTASDSEGPSGTERLKVESIGNTDLCLGQDNRDLVEQRHDGTGEGYGKENTMLFLSSLPNPSAYPQKGILKKKPLSPIAERNGVKRIHNELSVGTTGPASSRGSSSSEGCGGGARTTAQEHPNGVTPVSMTPIAMSIKAGTVDDDSSGSENRMKLTGALRCRAFPFFPPLEFTVPASLFMLLKDMKTLLCLYNGPGC